MNNKKLSMLNSMSSLFTQMALIFLQFIQRKVFLDYLSVELLGIQGTLTAIVAAATLADGGIQSAIIYNLYVPLHDGDEARINKLMNVYRFMFNALGAIIISLAIVCAPFLPYVLTGVDVTFKVYVYYFLITFNAAAGYFLSYRRAIFVASRTEYVLKIADFVCNVIFCIVKILVLVIYQNFILFLIAEVLRTVASNLLIHVASNKRFSYLKEEKHDEECRKELMPQMKELFVGGIAAYVFASTDSIIISKFVNTVSVGMLAGYTMVTSNLRLLIVSLFTFCGPLLGNIIVKSAPRSEERKNAFELYSIGLYAVAMLVLVAEAVLLEDFVLNVWGNESVLAGSICTLLIVEQYFTVVQDSCGVYVVADGNFRASRNADGVAAVSNLLVSLILVPTMGMSGVLMGTIVGRMFQWGMKSYYAVVVCMQGKKCDYAKYWLKNIYKLALFGATVLLVFRVSNMFNISNFLIRFIVVGAISVACAVIVLLMYLFTTGEMRLVKQLINRK